MAVPLKAVLKLCSKCGTQLCTIPVIKNGEVKMVWICPNGDCPEVSGITEVETSTMPLIPQAQDTVTEKKVTKSVTKKTKKAK